MALTQWINFDNSPLDGGYDYTLGATEIVEDDLVVNYNDQASLVDNGGGDYSLKFNHWSVEYRAPNSDSICPGSGFRVFVEMELPTPAGNQNLIEFTSASGDWNFSVKLSSTTHVRAAINTSSMALECYAPFFPSDDTKFCFEFRWDPSESTNTDRLIGRAWESGDTVPSFTAGSVPWGTIAAGTADWTYSVLGDGGNGGNHEYFKLIVDDDPDVDLSAYEDTEDAPGGGGATVGPDDLVQVQAIDAPTLSQDHQLTASELVQLQVIDAPTLSQDHQLTATDLVQIQEIDPASVSVTGVLTAAELVQLQALDVVVITQDHQLTASKLVQLQVIDASSVTQSAVVTALDLVQLQGLDAVVIVVQGVLSPSDLVQLQALDAVVISQDHQLTASELVQLQVMGGAGVGIPTDYIPLGRAIIIAKRSRAISIVKRLRAMRVER